MHSGNGNNISGMPRQRPAPGHRRLTRRWAAACAAVVLAVVPLAVAKPAAAAAGQVSVAITSISPGVARPGHPVTVSGVVSNMTDGAMSGLSVQLRSSGSALISRGDLTNYAAGNLPVDTPVAGAVAQLPGTLNPGATEQWTVSLPVREVGMTVFGVYPLAAEVDANGGALDTDYSFLPFWPGKSASGLAGPLQIAWVWPLVGPPQRAACPALLSNSLAASVAGTGRLAALLAAGSTSAAASANLTWAIDPGLLASVSAMTQPYSVGGSTTCAGTTSEPASRAARAWLATLRSVTAQQDFFVTPYNDVDVAALAHQGMDQDLTYAFGNGRSEARAILGRAQRPATAATDLARGQASLQAGVGGMAWPAAGIADYGVLGSLAVNGTGTVILDSTMMPPLGQVNFTPSAVTRTPDGVGAELHVALADDTLTQILGTSSARTAGRPAAAGAATAGASFATEQRFLAETAMIAAEQPWLRPVSLANLVTANSPAGQVPRQQPPQQLSSHDELGASLLRQVRQLNVRLRLHGSILDPPDGAYLSKAVAAVESSAWRGASGARQASGLLERVSDYLASQERLVQIIEASQVTLGGQSGPVPISITNKLDQAVTVRLSVQAPNDGRVTILPYKATVTIGAGQQRTIPVKVKAAAAGTTTLRLSLLTPGGTPLPGTATTLTVNATHFGTLALVIIGIAVAVFAATSAGRAFRRGRRPRGGAEPADPEGGPSEDTNSPDPASGRGEADNVSRGPAQHDDRPEEPDEYASIPGRAERP